LLPLITYIAETNAVDFNSSLRQIFVYSGTKTACKLPITYNTKSNYCFQPVTIEWFVG